MDLKELEKRISDLESSNISITDALFRQCANENRLIQEADELRSMIGKINFLGFVGTTPQYDMVKYIEWMENIIGHVDNFPKMSLKEFRKKLEGLLNLKKQQLKSDLNT